MKIVIMGAGKVGQVICSDLSKEDHDITLIEKNNERLEEMLNEFDINGILGNGASYEIQKEVGVDTCDIFVAVTDDDELNMISCVLARSIGAKHTLARVRKQEYSSWAKIIGESLGLSYLLNPELQTAEYIKRLISFPQAISYQKFMSSKAPIVEMKVSEDSDFIGKKVADFRSLYPDLIVCAVEDEDDIFIPKGDHFIKEGNHIFVTGPTPELIKLFHENGQNERSIKSILIIGGGLITRYLLKLLEKTKIKIKVFEINKKKAEDLSLTFPNVEVINDDGTSIKNLKEQRAKDFDAFFALTGIDEENIIVSMIAKKLGIEKILTKISRTELYPFVDLIGLDSIVTPKRIVADSILQKVRALINSDGSSVEALYTLAESRIEALQFKVKEGSRITESMIKDLPIADGNLIAYIVRKGEILFPTGYDQILPNDRVLIISQNQKLDELDDILR
ncbi:MAG: Trk system potassium transporter TrkA [Finegoldia sp.]|nr:Trk system potassium transporter TrkA [Finegoldia sp.]